jgi:hypothetical protein
MENYNRIEKTDNIIYYYLNEKLHRLDGPAYENKNGRKAWFQNDKYHRLDGPAIEWEDGDKWWYYEGEKIKCDSQEEFERIIKLKLFW